MSKKLVEAGDLYQYHFPHDLNCSPDGTYAAFLMTHMNEKTDGYNHDIYLLNLETGKQTVLTQSGDVGAFSWLSPEEIMFQSARSGQKKGTTDIFRISILGGEAEKMFTIPVKSSIPVRLSEGNWLIQVRKPTDPKEAAKDRAVEGVDFWTFTDKPFLKNGEDFSERKRTTLGIFHEADKSIDYVTPKYFETSAFDISADKKKIVYFGAEYEECSSLYHGIRCYDVETGETEVLIEDGIYQISTVKWLASGRLFVQASRLESSVTENHDLYILNPESKEMTMIQRPDGMYSTLIDVDTVYGGGRGAKVLGNDFVAIRLKKSKTVIDCVDTSNGTIREIALVDALTSFDTAGEYLYAVALENYEMAEIYQIHMKTGEKKKMTSFSDEYVSSHALSVPEKLVFTAKNGEEVEGFVIRPTEFDETKKYPGVVFIHGGPKWAYSKSLMHLYQCLASRGMFVMYCNQHGSDGYGNKFLEMVHDWGEVDYNHIMEFTDECLKNYPNLDEERLGVTGGSYGGYMTNWIIGHTDRFKAAISQRGICNMVTMAFTSDFGERVLKQSCGESTPWNNEAELWDKSPLKYAAQVKTPTLFMHSDKDFRCFMGEAFQMFTALKQTGVETELYLFHGAAHGLSRNGKPSHRLVRNNAMIEWFEKYLS